MASQSPGSPRAAAEPPVHAHRQWRHLQRAAVAAHKQLTTVTQADFCALFVPAASIALWILQHAPHLAQRKHLHILIAQASEYQALDSGRWLHFIPWLLGRPALQLRLSVVGGLGLPESGVPAEIASSESGVEAWLAHRFQSRAGSAVKAFPPAELHHGTVKSWSEHESTRAPSAPVPDLCAMFAPALWVNHPDVLSETGVLPLLRDGVPLALFSSSEGEQLLDVYMLAAAGIDLPEPDAWPNPWALAAPGAKPREGVYAKMAWSAVAGDVPVGAQPNPALVAELDSVLEYIHTSADGDRFGADAVLNLGAPLKAAASSAPDPESVSVLFRLPHDIGVDATSGHIYQLQDNLALLLDAPAVPASILDAYPGDEHLLLRAMWATSVHRDHVFPFVQHVDAALASQFSSIDALATA